MEIPSHVYENGKADFMDMLYARSGRTNGTYTDLWQEFCLEAGTVTRANYVATNYQDRLAVQTQVSLAPEPVEQVPDAA